MNLRQQVFVNVSGMDPNEGAHTVFIWGRNNGAAENVLLGSGHIVDCPAHARPPGIQAGQFSVTFLLPSGCSADDVFVTDDKAGSERLIDVTVVVGLGQSKSPREQGIPVADESVLLHRTNSDYRSSATLNGRG